MRNKVDAHGIGSWGGRPRALARRWSALSVALALQAALGLAQANVGRTTAQFHVDQLGEATYTIPIWAPRGPNGLAPHIALTYNSQNGGGDVGAGWQISGISSIARCNRTTAQDGTPAAVALSTNDALCLDGERLQLTGGTNGEAGSTYQTEIANFEQVTAYGSAGNGPAYFVVQAPNGTEYEYGNGGGSEVLAYGTGTASQWYLDKVTDRAGNTMTVSYYEGTGQSYGSAVPETISWTPSSHGATTYDYTMQFAYGTNSAASSTYGYLAGTTVTDTYLLQSITVEYEGTTVKKYALTYQSSPATGAEELKEVEECADAAESNCLAPTTFAYQDPPAGTVASATAAISGAPVRLVWNYDFNGDGSDDLAYCTAAPGLQLQVAFASSSGYETPINTGIPCETSGLQSALYGDFLGNHKDGILAVNNGTWYYYQWNGSAFVGQSTGIAFQNAVQYVLADVTGNGRPDLVSLNYVPATGLPQEVTIDVRMNTSSGSTASLSSTNTQWYSLSLGTNLAALWTNIQSTSDGQNGSLGSGALRHLDFNGSGRDDLAFEYQIMTCLMIRGVCHDQYSDHAVELISTGSSFTSTQIATATTMTFGAVEFLKFNSDACTDYLYNSVVYVSGCNGAPATSVTVPSSSVVGAMDWDADGRTDILINNGGTIGVYESTGTGLTGLIATSIPYSANDVYFAFDPSGGGLDSLGAWNDEVSPYAVSYYAHNGVGEPPALLTSITDGYGNTVKPAYVSLSQGSGSTYTPTSDATFPYTNYTGPLYVVSQVTYSDPSNPPNGTYQQTHYYSGAWMNEQGRGFAGFETHSVYDSRNKLYGQQTFNLTFPLTGMLRADTVTESSASGQTVSSLSNTLTQVTLASGSGAQRYFDYVSASTAKQYEVGGEENGELITTRTGSYSYDNYGNLTSSSQTTTDNDGGSPYDGDTWTTSVTNTPDEDTSTWCLTLLSESQVSYTASSGNSVLRTRQYSPDLTDCRYDEIITEPSSSSYKVTEQLGYDSFGNINSDTVTGIGMTARATSANWGTSGQFPMSVTDASGATTQLNYNFSYGLVSSETDPNGLTTTWQYGEGFGRPTRESWPDGTYTTYSYALFSGDSPLPRLVVTAEPHDTSNNVISTTEVYFDMADRLWLKSKTILDGSEAGIVYRTYDSLGRVASDYFPYSWAAGPTGAVTYSYDILNRVTRSQRPISQSDSTLQTTSYGYAGRTTTITDPNGHTRTLIHDVNGWLRRTKDALGYEVILGYDAAGAKTSVTDSLGNTLWTGTYAYGIAPFLVGESDMDRGAWGYTVDALGERTAWTDPKAQHFYASYDALSRPYTRTEPDLFTQWTWGSSAASHNIGKLASVCTGTGSACSASDYSEDETYDSLGRLYQRSIVIPGMGTYAYTWQYDATTGLLDTLTYPVSTSGQALELKYAYQYGILQSITDVLDSPNVTIWQADAQNAAGQITQETLGNGLVTNRTYDAVTHWLSSVQSGPGGGASVQNQSFLYDEVGNVTQRQDNNLGLSENFYYDNDNRLKYSTLNGTQNLSLNYDPMGNISSRTDVAGGATWTYDPVHLHEVTEAGSSAYQYVYDPNGNVNSREGSSISWSSYNYPTLINDTATGESVSFLYGPDRRAWLEQTTSSSGTETTYRVGGLLDIVVESAGVTDYRHYIYAGSEPVAIDSRRRTGTNAYYYLLSDQEGSIAAITNSAGAVVVGESFTAYGNRRNPGAWYGAPSSSDLNTIAGITRQGYTFQEALGSMGLNDMVGRVQDAVTGRFLSADPNIPDPSDPQSYNRYSYTRNNPLTYTDPTGFEDKCVGSMIQTCAGGSSNVVTGPAAQTVFAMSVGGGGPSGFWLDNSVTTSIDDSTGFTDGLPTVVSVTSTSSQSIWMSGLDFADSSPYAFAFPEPSGQQCNAVVDKCYQPPQKPNSNQPPQSNPTQCTALQKVVGTLQNQVANEIDGLSLNYGVDFLYGTGSQILYGTGSISINSRGQVVLSYGTSNSMQGFVYGAMGGGGYGFGRSAGPATSGNGTSTAAVGGIAVVDDGVIASGSMDPGSTSLPAPGGMVRGDFAGGLGFGGAKGDVQTTTVSTPPLIPQIPTSSCHE